MDNGRNRIKPTEAGGEPIAPQISAVGPTLDETVARIAQHPKPVELVNNMYGCHPDGDGSEYFDKIYGK